MRLSRHILLSLFLLLAGARLAVAGNPLYFHHLDRAQGLLHANATCVAQDPDGYIWIGTHCGLNRYDGYRLEGFSVPPMSADDDNAAVMANRVYALAPLGSYIWLATEDGLRCFDRRQRRFVEPRLVNGALTDFRPQWVKTLGASGLLYAADSRTGHVVRVETDPQSRLPMLHSLHQVHRSQERSRPAFIPRLTSTGTDDIGTLWLSSDRGFEAFAVAADGTLRPLSVVTSVDANGIFALHGDDTGALWVAYEQRVAMLRASDSGALTLVAEVPVTQGRINSLAVGADCVWAGTDHGATRLPKDNFTASETHTAPLTLVHSTDDPHSVVADINSLLVDRDGNLWASGWMAGVCFATPMGELFGTLRAPHSAEKATDSGSAATTNFITALCHDAATNRIFAARKYGGIAAIDAATTAAQWDFGTLPELRQSITAMTMTGTSQPQLAVATGYRWLLLNPASGALESAYTAANGGYTFDIKSDSHGHLWVATSAGLECWQKADAAGDWRLLRVISTDSPAPLTLSSNELHNLYIDEPRGEIIATSSRGINRIWLDARGMPQRVRSYHAHGATGVNSDFLWSVAPDPSEVGAYWVAALGRGLNHIAFHGDSVSATALPAGGSASLADDVESILTDAFGRVWTAGYGLRCLDPKSGAQRSFGPDDGLQGLTFGTSSAVADADGRLWFGGVNGINFFSPSELNSSQGVRTRALITSIDLPEGARSQGDTIVWLAYPHNGLSVAFSTLAFGAASHVAYRYRLLGSPDASWHLLQPGEAPAAAWSNLPEGEFTLEVQGGDGSEWDPIAARLQVRSAGPWYGTWWAWLLWLSLLASGAWLAGRSFVKWSSMKAQIALQSQREEQQQQMMDLKVRFFTDVSHEFRTPLTLIRHASSELAKRYGADEPQVRMLTRNAGVLSNMVNELLDFHRADRASLALRTTLTSVVPFATTIVEEFQPWAHDAGLQLGLTAADGDLQMWLDREIFCKVLSNLLSNALRYTETPGTVRVSLATGLYQDTPAPYPASHAIVDSMEPGTQLILTVADSGPTGIAPERLADIFERLHQGDNGAAQQPYGSSGIGLALVRALLRLHHGGVRVSSEQGRGTTFEVFLPMTYTYLTPEQKASGSTFQVGAYLNDATCEPSPAAAIPQPSKAPVADAPTLLLVDDSVEILQMLQQQLGDSYNLLFAANGDDALRLVAREMPELVVADVMMPGISGTQLCANIKASLRTCHIPVILLTAMAHEQSKIEGIEHGADAYIVKPYNPRLLVATIANLLKRQRQSATATGDSKAVAEPTRAQAQEKNAQEFLRHLSQVVAEHIADDDFSVDDLCRAMAMSRSRLYDMVKEVAGCSLGTFIKRQRLERAAELLRTSTANISEAAAAVGIFSSAYFTRAFRQHTGLTPSDYKKKYS